jgi:hypothetical protein
MIPLLSVLGGITGAVVAFTAVGFAAAMGMGAPNLKQSDVLFAGFMVLSCTAAGGTVGATAGYAFSFVLAQLLRNILAQ